MGNIHETEGVIPYFWSLLHDDPLRNTQALRKGMVGELFIIYIIYVVSMILRKPNQSPPIPNEDKQQAPSPSGFQKKPFLTNHKMIDERFPVFFMHHTIALAFSLVWAPYEFEIAISYIHLLAFIGFLAGSIKEIELLRIICYGTMIIINLILILAALVNLGDMK